MAHKPIPCTIVFNTKWGYVMQPRQCKSIREALRLAKEEGMAYRIFDMQGNQIRQGWIVS